MYFHVENNFKTFRLWRGKGLSPAPHIHAQIEIVLLHSGKTVATADNRSVTLQAGDLFIAFPNQIHYYEDVGAPPDFSITLFPPDICPEFSRYFKSMIPKSPLLCRAGENRVLADAMENAILQSREDSEFSRAEVRGNLLILTSEILKNCPLEEKGEYAGDLLKDILNYCYENYSGNISLCSVAEALHVSRCYISKIFSRRIHTGFNDYINALRIHRACELLKAHDKTITEISYAVGYNSVRTFDRCFRNIQGQTPKEYRAGAKNAEMQAF